MQGIAGAARSEKSFLEPCDQFLKQSSCRCCCSPSKLSVGWRVGQSLPVCFINVFRQRPPAVWNALCWIGQRQSVNPLHAWLERRPHHMQPPVWQTQLILVT